MRRIDKILQFYDDARQAIAGLIRTLLHAFIIDPLADSAPALAPLVPAISTYRALAGEVGADLGIANFWLVQAIAISGAIAIEAAGMSVSKTALRAYRWALAANKSEARFPWYVYTAPAICFYCVVVVLTLTIEYSGILWAVYPLFVLIAVSTYVSLAIADNLAQWEKAKVVTLAEQAKKRGLSADIRLAEIDLDTLVAEIDTAKNNLIGVRTEAAELGQTVEKLQFERDKLAEDISNRTRQLNRLTAANEPTNSPVMNQSAEEKMALLDKANETRKLTKQDRLNRIIELSEDHSQPEMAQILDVSISTIKRDIKSLNGSLQGAK